MNNLPSEGVPNPPQPGTTTPGTLRSPPPPAPQAEAWRRALEGGYGRSVAAGGVGTEGAPRAEAGHGHQTIQTGTRILPHQKRLGFMDHRESVAVTIALQDSCPADLSGARPTTLR